MATQQEQDAAVSAVLEGNGGECWRKGLRAYIRRAILGRARSLLGVQPLPAEWNSLDDIEYRAAAAGPVEQCAEQVAKDLARDDVTYAEFKRAVEAVGRGLTRVKLENALRSELTKLIAPADVRGYAEAVTPARVWGELANLIAAEVHAAESQSPPQGEADCLRWSLLAAFFQATKIPDATQLGGTLRDSLTRGRFGIRGSLLRNVDKTSAAGVVDPPLTHVAYGPVALASAHRAASQLLASVAAESHKVPASKGFAVAVIGEQIRKDPPAVSPEMAHRGITAEMALDSRIFRYQQYEYSALSLSAIAATEFCLRCAAEASPTLNLDPRYAGQGRSRRH